MTGFSRLAARSYQHHLYLNGTQFCKFAPNNGAFTSLGLSSNSPCIRNISITPSCYLAPLVTEPFRRLVQSLKLTNQTCTIVESSCGGLISSSLMGVPGSSACYFGGTVAYNTKKSGKLLCGDEELHGRLLSAPVANYDDDRLLEQHGDLSEEARKYIKSKLHWTRETALKYCDHVQTDFAIAEGGATGPSFRPKCLDTGFAVLAVAGRRSRGGEIEILAQKIIRSSNANREGNMRLFSDSAAELCLEAMSIANPNSLDSTKSSNLNNSGNINGGIFLDRSSHLRNDAVKMQGFYDDVNALNVIIRGTDEVLFSSPTKLALPTMSNIIDDGTIGEELLRKRTFLGRIGTNQTPVFAISLPKDTPYTSQDGYFAVTRSRAPMLVPVHNELALTATAYVNWQNSHQFCHICGSPMEYIHGGTCAKCMNANGKPHFHWPRQDPSIIVLVTNAGSTHALLARSPRHPTYLYTAIAGFVEAGETFESATCREVHEEVGVHIDRNSINYIASQPWPFPRSTMIGMRASTLDCLSPIHIDPNEIVDAKWFEKEAVYQAARDSDSMGAVLEKNVVEERQAKGEWHGKLLVPSKGVLARTLVDHWLESA